MMQEQCLPYDTDFTPVAVVRESLGYSARRARKGVFLNIRLAPDFGDTVLTPSEITIASTTHGYAPRPHKYCLIEVVSAVGIEPTTY